MNFLFILDNVNPSAQQLMIVLITICVTAVILLFYVLFSALRNKKLKKTGKQIFYRVWDVWVGLGCTYCALGFTYFFLWACRFLPNETTIWAILVFFLFPLTFFSLIFTIAYANFYVVFTEETMVYQTMLGIKRTRKYIEITDIGTSVKKHSGHEFVTFYFGKSKFTLLGNDKIDAIVFQLTNNTNNQDKSIK